MGSLAGSPLLSINLPLPNFSEKEVDLRTQDAAEEEAEEILRESLRDNGGVARPREYRLNKRSRRCWPFRFSAFESPRRRLCFPDGFAESPADGGWLAVAFQCLSPRRTSCFNAVIRGFSWRWAILWNAFESFKAFNFFKLCYTIIFFYFVKLTRIALLRKCVNDKRKHFYKMELNIKKY